MLNADSYLKNNSKSFFIHCIFDSDESIAIFLFPLLFKKNIWLNFKISNWFGCKHNFYSVPNKSENKNPNQNKFYFIKQEKQTRNFPACLSVLSLASLCRAAYKIRTGHKRNLNCYNMFCGNCTICSVFCGNCCNMFCYVLRELFVMFPQYVTK